MKKIWVYEGTWSICIIYVIKMHGPSEVMMIQTWAMVGKWVFSSAVEVTQGLCFRVRSGKAGEVRALGSGDCNIHQPHPLKWEKEKKAKSRSTIATRLSSDNMDRSHMCWHASLSQDSEGERTRSSRTAWITQQDFVSTTKIIIDTVLKDVTYERRINRINKKKDLKKNCHKSKLRH